MIICFTVTIRIIQAFDDLAWWSELLGNQQVELLNAAWKSSQMACHFITMYSETPQENEVIQQLYHPTGYSLVCYSNALA